MHPSRRLSLILLTFILAVAIVACRRDEEEPVPTPVDTGEISPTAEPTTKPTQAATPVATRPTATPIPSISEIDWAPQVVYSSPAPGEETSLNGAITVRFDQPMDQETVEAAFSVIGENDDEVLGRFSWPGPETVIFTPVTDYQRKAEYRVTIDDTAQGVNGETLRESLELKLETVGYLQVSQIIPADGTADVDTDAAITVMFNRPVVPLVATSQQADLPTAVVIDPPVAGTGSWISSSIYRFVPDEPLDGATTYDVTVPVLEDVTGGVMGDSITARFTTFPPAVVNVTPANSTSDVIPTEPMTITFNMPMDPTSVADALRLTPSTGISLDWSEDGRVVTITPDQRLGLGQTYTLELGVSARSANGQATLQRTVTSAFDTVPFPAVVDVMPAPDVEAHRYERGINIFFASPMDMDTLDGQLRISPAPEDPDYYYNSYDNSLYISFNFERNADYTVTVPASAADPYGNTLGEDYTWRFTTPPYDPLVSLNLPPRVSQISTSYPSNVEILHRNVSQFDVQLYDLGLELALLAEPWSTFDFTPSTPALFTWSINVESALDQVDVYTLPLNDGDPLPTGVYLLNVSSADVESNARFWQNQRHTLIVADTNLVIKEMTESVHVWATDLATGQPAANRTLTLYDFEGVESGTATTNESGFATFDYPNFNNYLAGVTVISNAPGQTGFGAASSNWNEGVSPWQYGIDVNWNREMAPYAYLYTDRPIYRPGDTVYFRGIVRDPNFGRYNLPSVKDVPVSIGFIFAYGEPILTYTAELDANGTFDGEFVVPDEADLGPYRLYLEMPNMSAERMFTVAEYRKPEFLVEVLPAVDEALRGETVDVTIQAEYLFGAPATDLEVNWSVSHRAFNLPWEGPYYSFSNDNFSFYYREPFGGGFSGQQVLSGIGRLDADGALDITLPASILEEAPDGSRVVTVEANVFDISEFPVAARAEVTFHSAKTYVGVAPVNYIDVAGTEAEVDVITVDWDSQPVPNTDVEVVFYSREWESRRVQEFGAYYTEWTPVDTEVARTAVTTDGDGEATASFVPEIGGTYLAEATVTDDTGRVHASTTFLWITDANFVGWRSAPRERRMDLTPDKQDYQVGDTANVLVQSPFAPPVQAWVTIERGELLEQRLVTLTSNSDVLEIPIDESFAPNVYVTVVAVKGIDDANRYADIRMGITELEVSTERLALNLSLTPREEIAEPGGTVTFDILVTDWQDQGVQADLSLALVDEAVLSLLEDNAPDILEAFYRPQPYRSQVGAGLFISGEGLEIEVPVEQLGMGGGGGGEAPVAEFARLEDESQEGETGVREDFRDTAFWQASLTTAADGTASVAIRLPDNLTTWRLSSKAVTRGSLVGQASATVVATKPLLLRPVTPRFLTVGDVVQLGAVVQNNTGAELDVSVRLEAEGVLIDDAATQTVSIDAGRGELVRWTVRVEDVTSVALVFRAEGGGYADASRPTVGQPPDQSLPVYRYDAADFVGTSGVLDDENRIVEGILLPPGVDTRLGGVDVKLSPSLAAALLETLDAIERHPGTIYRCAPNIVDQMLPNVVTARVLSVLDVDDAGLEKRLTDQIALDLADIERLQKRDGGWGWCFSEESSPWLSAYVLLGLAKADEAGYDVPATTLDRGISYVLSQLEPVERLNETWEVNRQIFFLYVLAENDEFVSDALDELFDERRDLPDPYAKALMIAAYELSGGGRAERQSLFSDLANSVVLSATGAHWEDQEPDWNNLSSDIRGTAIVLAAYAKLDPGNPLATNAVRWLMTAREASRWPSGQETSWAVLALTDWMKATGELEAAFDYTLAANLTIVGSGSFDETNIAEAAAYEIPISDLRPNEVNYLFVEKQGDNGRLYYTAHLNSFIDANQVDAVSRGVTVQRAYYDAACEPSVEDPCPTIDSIEAGQQVRVELTIIAPNDLVYVVVEDPFPAGAEGIDPNLETSVGAGRPTFGRVDRNYRYGYWGYWYFNRIEFRDDRVAFLSDFLPAGTYQYTYTLQASIPGIYQVRPAVAQESFFPEVFGRSDGIVFEVVE